MKYIITQKTIDLLTLPDGYIWAHSLLSSLKPLQPMTTEQMEAAMDEAHTGYDLILLADKHHGIGE